jgi:hypothetical protein
VLRSSRQATPASSQFSRRISSPRILDDDDELATKVLSLLESFDIQLNSKQVRKLQVLVDDYVEDLEKRISGEDEGYVVD